MKHLIACAALIVLAGVIAFVHERDRPVLRADDNLQPFSEKAPAFSGAIDDSRLDRDRLLKLLEANVELLNDEQLQKLVERLKNETRAMRAKQKLDQTAETLQTIVTEFEGTPAAETVRRMLQAMKPAHAPAFDSPAPSQRGF